MVVASRWVGPARWKSTTAERGMLATIFVVMEWRHKLALAYIGEWGVGTLVTYKPLTQPHSLDCSGDPKIAVVRPLLYCTLNLAAVRRLLLTLTLNDVGSIAGWICLVTSVAGSFPNVESFSEYLAGDDRLSG